ncbi:hypothetical protein Pelo_8281 [Pelomyxa schiedti]|nr:hypothetical protein Pelo_8281 [Pelomyxa schiedti]
MNSNEAPCTLERSIATLGACQQLLAFACASHPRCGATSPARALWLHGPSLAIAVRDACCVRGRTSPRGALGRGAPQRPCLVVLRCGLVTFGISPVLLGVTHDPAVVPQVNFFEALVGCDRVLKISERGDLVLFDRDCGTTRVVLRGADWGSRGYLPHGVSNNERWLMWRTEGKIVVFDLCCDEPRESRVTVSDTFPKREPHFIWSKYILDEVVLIVTDHAEGSTKFVSVDVERTFTEKRLCVLSVTSVPIEDVSGLYDFYHGTLHMKGSGVECVVVNNGYGVVHVALPGGKPQYLRMEPPSLSQLNRHQFCIQSFPRGRPPLFEVWDCRNVTAPLSSIETPEDFSVFGGSGFLFSTTKGTLTVTEASSGFLVLTLSFSVQHVMINQARSYL